MGSNPGSWELVESPTVDPQTTMALDERLFESAVAKGGPARVRIYRWGGRALSTGRNLTLEEPVLRRCEDAEVEVVRRITGGGAVLHGDDLTYCVVGRHCGLGVLETYRWVAKALIEGLRRIGIDAEVSSHPLRTMPVACFSEPSGADLAVGGRKLCGSAQVRKREWFLQHGSIPIADVRDETARLLGTPPARASTCLAAIAPGTRFEQLAGSLAAGFGSLFGEDPLVRQGVPSY